jgi:transketolase
MRLGGRVEEPLVTDPAAPFRVGRAAQLREGDDVAVIACGALVEMAVRASDALRKEGIGARVLNMHTIKPLDREAILSAAAQTRGVVTAEEHHLTGGLGGAVAELLSVERPTRMRMVGMPDAFAMIGPTVALRAKYGMSAEGVAQACRDVLQR